MGGLGRLATQHLPGGPVGLPARWAATSNVEYTRKVYSWSLRLPLTPKFKTKVSSELLSPQTSRRPSSFVTLLWGRCPGGGCLYTWCHCWWDRPARWLMSKWIRKAIIELRLRSLLTTVTALGTCDYLVTYLPATPSSAGVTLELDMGPFLLTQSNPIHGWSQSCPWIGSIHGMDSIGAETNFQKNRYFLFIYASTKL